MPNKHPFFDFSSVKTIFILVILLILLFSIHKFVLEPLNKEPTYVTRAAVDIGSGATKLRVAEVDLKNNKIRKVLVNETFPVHYQEQLEKSPDKVFDEKVMQAGIEALKKSKEIADRYHVQKIVAVATAAFRKAANSEEFANRIFKETGIKIYIIGQDLEGKLAFEAVVASQVNEDPKKLVVWDIGGGSFQFTSQTADGKYLIYRGHEASTPFKNRVIQEIQHHNINEYSTPNPMSEEQINQAIDLAKNIAQKVDQVFKDKISQPDTKVIGVGNIFAYGIYPLVGKKSPFIVKDLASAVKGLANKTDAEVGGGDFANVYVTNAILVLGFMETINLDKMQILDVNNADGAILYAPFGKIIEGGSYH